jgi:hypothetical protein
VLARYRSRLSQECALLGPSALLPCASDGGAFDGDAAGGGASDGSDYDGGDSDGGDYNSGDSDGGAAGGGGQRASFASVDGCCLESCAAALVRVSRRIADGPCAGWGCLLAQRGALGGLVMCVWGLENQPSAAGAQRRTGRKQRRANAT